MKKKLVCFALFFTTVLFSNQMKRPSDQPERDLMSSWLSSRVGRCIDESVLAQAVAYARRSHCYRQDGSLLIGHEVAKEIKKICGLTV